MTHEYNFGFKISACFNNVKMTELDSYPPDCLMLKLFAGKNVFMHIVILFYILNSVSKFYCCFLKIKYVDISESAFSLV